MSNGTNDCPVCRLLLDVVRETNRRATRLKICAVACAVLAGIATILEAKRNLPIFRKF